jgi:hypothetical protein
MYVWKENEQWHFKSQLIVGSFLGVFDKTRDAAVIAQLEGINKEHSDHTTMTPNQLRMLELSRPYLNLTPPQQHDVIALLNTAWPLTTRISEQAQYQGCLSFLQRNALFYSNAQESELDKEMTIFISDLNAFESFFIASHLDLTLRSENFADTAEIVDIIRFIDYLMLASARDLGYDKPIELKTPPSDSHVKCGHNEYKNTNGSTQLLFQSLLSQAHQNALFELILAYESTPIHALQ